MGKWLEVLTERPPDSADYSQRQPLRLAEVDPNPLLWAGRYLNHEHRGVFPNLVRARVASPAYVDEWLWLDSKQASDLLQELQKLRRVCHREEFVIRFDGPHYYEVWRDGEPSSEFESSLDRIEQALAIAVEGGHWVLLSL